MTKKKSLHRLIATCAMTAFTAASLITTSYAFVTLNTEATVSQFEFDIVDQEGLLLSVDGNNFFQDIDFETIKGAILANNKASTYADLKLSGVTLGGASGFVLTTDTVDANNFNNYYVKTGLATYAKPSVYDSTATYYEATAYDAGLHQLDYSYQIGNAGPKIADKKYTFVKDKSTMYSSTDSAIANSTNATITALRADNDRVGLHSYIEADSSDYIFFDLWLRVAQTGDNHPTYKLRLSDRTAITGKENEVELYNTLYVPETKDTRTYTTYDGNNVVKGKFLAGEKIKVNPANAMRLGLNVLSAATTNQDTQDTDASYGTNDGLIIYEPNEGLGSYAVSDGSEVGYTNAKYQPSQNAMYTYHNSLNPLAPFLSGVNNNGQLNTLANRTVNNQSLINDKDIATFTYDATSKKYNVVKISVMLWLEGWDADYFVGINNSNISVKLGFEIHE